VVEAFAWNPAGVVLAGNTVQIQVTVRNTGGTDGVVNGLAAGEVEAAPSVVGTPTAVAPGLPVTIPGGTVAVFGWSYTAGTCGWVTVTVTVTGSEPETGRTIPAVPASSPAEAVAGSPATLALVPAAPSGVVGSQVALTARLTDTCGIGVPGRSLSFSVLPADAVVQPATRVTGLDGKAVVTLVLGGEPGSNRVRVLLVSPSLSASVVVEGLPNPLSLAGPGSALDANVFRLGSGTPLTVRVAPRTGGATTVRVFTASGRLVQTLTKLVPIGQGQYLVVWDGRDNSGDPVVRGVYLIRVQGDGADEILKVVVR
jgi:hypothetical protein